MSAGVLIYFVALHVIMVLSAIMGLWCHYDDGVFGKFGLILCFFGAFIPAWEIWTGVEHAPLNTTIVLVVGFTCFLIRHFYRFIKFVSKQHGWRFLLSHKGPET